MSEIRNEAGTPRALFDVLQREYLFDVDIAASAHNAKLASYLTKADDALALDWAGLRVWCNPPFDNVPAWLAHAAEPILVAYLLPSRTDRAWWRDYKPLAEVHYFMGENPHRRIQYEPPPGVTYSSNPYSEHLMLFGEDTTPGLEVWRSGLTGERL